MRFLFVCEQRGGGGGPTTKKIMPPGKTQDVLRLFCSFFVLFQNTFKINVFVPNLVKMCLQKRTKKIMIFISFDLFCSFCRISLTKCPQTENKKDHAAGKIARFPLSFLLLDPPPPPNR